MTLIQFLSEKRDAILKRWFDVVLDSYPPDTAAFLKNQQNRFTNPVGHTILQGMEQVLDSLSQQELDGPCPEFLDNIIRVRAVQDLTASGAVSFIFSLKPIIRDLLRAEKVEPFPYEEAAVVDSRIDRLALLAFDVFMQCREKLYDIKANELRNMTFRLLQRVNRIDGDQEPRTGPECNSENAQEKEVTP